MERLSGLYGQVVRAVLVSSQIPTFRDDSFLVPVIPGAFPGESVNLVFTSHPETLKISMTASARIGPDGARYESTGPLHLPEGVMELQDFLFKFAKDGPERISRRFRELIQELLRAGVDIEDVHAEVDLALAESVMAE